MQMEPGGTDKYAQLLDDALWRLVSEWRHNHNIVFNPSRCAGCLVINHTQCPVQFTDFELREGKDYAVFGVGDGFDKDSRTLQANGGAAIVFAFGCVPSLTDLAHVRLQVFTSASRRCCRRAAAARTSPTSQASTRATWRSPSPTTGPNRSSPSTNCKRGPSTTVVRGREKLFVHSSIVLSSSISSV
jgi:hypothetical protein